MRAWRRYKKNEVFLDVVESVHLLVNSNGTVVRSEVMGALKMRTFLSGMPECKLGLNDKVSDCLLSLSASRAQRVQCLWDIVHLHCFMAVWEYAGTAQAYATLS